LTTLLCASCGGSASAPSPSVAQVGGTWRGTATLLSVSGGESLGPGFTSGVGQAYELVLDLTQKGATLNQTSGDCFFTGSIANNTVSLQLSSGACMDTRRIICATGDVRDIRLMSSTTIGVVTGRSMSGTYTDSTNVLLPGTSTVAGVLVTNV